MQNGAVVFSLFYFCPDIFFLFAVGMFPIVLCGHVFPCLYGLGVESRVVLPPAGAKKRVTTSQLSGLSDSVSLLHVCGSEASSVSLRAARGHSWTILYRGIWSGLEK